MVSVTSREESGSTSSSAWKSRMRTVPAEVGPANNVPNIRAGQRRAPRRKRRDKRLRVELCRRFSRHRMPAETIERGSGRWRRAEVDTRNFAFGRSRDFEELARFEIAHARNHIGRKLLHAGVEIAHRSVVITARILQRVFNLVERGLKLGKVVRGAKLRVGFRERKELAQSTAQHSLGLTFGRGTLRG